MRWHPGQPKNTNLIRILRGDRITFQGYVTEVKPGETTTQVTGKTAEGLLQDMPLRFDPPAAACTPGSRKYWWCQLQYVFEDLEDPRLFPPLPNRLPTTDGAKVQRYIDAAHALSASGVVRDEGGVSVHHNKEADETTVEASFPPTDVQIGFSTLLRQFHTGDEKASFKNVCNVLRQASYTDTDPETASRQRYLRSWSDAAKKLRKRSIDQLVRDCFVEREGWKAWGYKEPTSPADLLNIFNYGEFIHWDRHADEVETEDEVLAAEQRMDFLVAALGLAHLYIGFGELVRAAITPRNTLLIPSG